jgi:hypothetical protein
MEDPSLPKGGQPAARRLCGLVFIAREEARGRPGRSSLDAPAAPRSAAHEPSHFSGRQYRARSLVESRVAARNGAEVTSCTNEAARAPAAGDSRGVLGGATISRASGFILHTLRSSIPGLRCEEYIVFFFKKKAAVMSFIN